MLYISHVIMLRFTDPADKHEAKDRLLAMSGQIPTMTSISVTIDEHDRPGAWDLSLTSTHESVADLDDYAAHPVHQEFLAWAKPRISERAVVDGFATQQ